MKKFLTILRTVFGILFAICAVFSLVYVFSHPFISIAHSLGNAFGVLIWTVLAFLCLRPRKKKKDQPELVAWWHWAE